MKEAFVDENVKVTVRDSDIPVPKEGEVLIKVVVVGTNPKDWKIPKMLGNSNGSNEGDDVSGYIESVGEGVVGFRKGDKVAAFHPMFAPHGGYAEYAIAPEYTTFHVPTKTSFEGQYRELSLV